jgi:DNA adenine methylase/adenine-specific DNA-methyltransferase
MPRPPKAFTAAQPRLKLVSNGEDFTGPPLPEQVALYPELRYMGSKHRLLPWIHEIFCTLAFDTAADPFVGSGCVAYLLKAMGKGLTAADFLNFPTVLARAPVANSGWTAAP